MPHLDMDLEEEMAAAAGAEDLPPGTLDKAIRRAARSVEKVTTAEALGRLYRQLQPERSRSESGLGGAKDLGDILSGVAKGYSSMGEAAAGLFKALTEMQKPGDRGDSGSSLAVGLLGAIVPLFMGMMQETNKHWEATLEGERRAQTELISDLRRQIQERSGPSQFDQIGQGMLQAMFQKQMAEITKGPKGFLEELTEVGERVGAARQALRNLGDPDRPEYSEGFLKHEELGLRRQEIETQARIQLEKAKQTRAMWNALGRAGPAGLGQIVAQGLQAFGLGVPQMGPQGMDV
jgi:hypothetical protein